MKFRTYLLLIIFGTLFYGCSSSVRNEKTHDLDELSIKGNKSNIENTKNKLDKRLRLNRNQQSIRTLSEIKLEISKLDEKIRNKQQRFTSLLKRYTPFHPLVIILKRDLSDLIAVRKQLSLELAKITPVKNVLEKKVKQKPQKPWMPKILQSSNTHYLPDFSFAGYKWGESPLPQFSGKIFSITDYGAKPNDKIDDTQAILKAISLAHKHPGPVIVFFPKGQFIVTQILHITRGNIVFRGAVGENNKKLTTLYFPKPITKVDLPASMGAMRDYFIRTNKRARGKLYSIASWTGGFVWTEKHDKKERQIAKATRGVRGSHLITINNGKYIKKGMKVNISWCRKGCNKSEFLSHVLDNQPVSIGQRTQNNDKQALITQTVTIESVNDKSLVIKEKLLHDIRQSWFVTLQSADFLENVGIEHLNLKFPKKKYLGHHFEAGYNGIYLKDLFQSWVRNVSIINGDNGILVEQSKNVTIYNVRFSGRKMHHAIAVATSNDILVKKFRLKANAIHGLCMNTSSKLNVFTNGQVVGGHFDQHNGLNHQNLFDNLQVNLEDVGKLFDHGGADYYQPTAGAFSTFWNINVLFNRHSKFKIKDAPSARIIGIRGSKRIKLQYGPNAYVEGLNKSKILVPSLYDYQLRNRLSKN